MNILVRIEALFCANSRVIGNKKADGLN